MTRLLRTPSFVADQRRVLLASAADFGQIARRRYAALIAQSLKDLAADPKRPGVKDVPGRPGLFCYHMRRSRRALPAEFRVNRPRHIIYFRLVAGRDLQLLRLLHEAMQPEDWLPHG